MILTPINRALLGSCMTAFVVCAGWPDIAAQEQSVEGVFALPDVEPLVSGEMTLQETGPLSRELQLVYTDLSTGKQIPKFDVELTQELHILATDAHHPRRRPPLLAEAREAAAKLVGDAEAGHLVGMRPQGIVDDAAPDELPALPDVRHLSTAPRAPSFWKRLRGPA